MSDTDKILKALKAKKFEVSFLSDDSSPCTVTKWISTGCIALDAIMGGQGIPTGRLVELFGEPASGKSLIAAQIAACAQSQGVLVGYADTESAVSMAMFSKLGVNTSTMLYTSPNSIEDIFAFFEGCVEARNKVNADIPLLLIWDSVAASSTNYEMENDYGKATMGQHAKMLSQGLRKFVRVISKQQIALLFLNQIRDKIGVMFGDKTTTCGGWAIQFYSSLRIGLKLSAKIKVENGKKKTITGINTHAICVKNKTAVPFMECTLPIYFSRGIDDAFATLYYMEDHDMVTNDSGHYSITVGGEETKFTKSTWRALFDVNKELFRDIIAKSIESDVNYMTKTEESETEEE